MGRLEEDSNIAETIVTVNEAFEDYVTDWHYTFYNVMGGYGSGKSYQTAIKIILKCWEETRKVLVVRQVYETIKESCFDLLREVMVKCDWLEENPRAYKSDKIMMRENGMQFKFPNGSRIIFKGLDKVDKSKSLNGVSIVWIEEATEVAMAAYNELLGRIRSQQSIHFILTYNPIGYENWVYKRFFKRIDPNTNVTTIIQDEDVLYDRKTVINKDTYYHHSTFRDNPYVTKRYIDNLNELKEYDKQLWQTAYHGKFGVSGRLVLPQFRVAEDAAAFKKAIAAIPHTMHFTGFDFGFEESFNAIVRMAVDAENSILYIYDEVYANGVTDDEFIEFPGVQKVIEYQKYCRRRRIQYNPVSADSSAPKDIKYYKNNGMDIRKCDNRGMAPGAKGTRIQNTKKAKRFHRIICSPKCVNVIRELQNLTYKVDKNGNFVYDTFNIDPHTFSAIWYGLDRFDFQNLKNKRNNSFKAA